MYVYFIINLKISFFIKEGHSILIILLLPSTCSCRGKIRFHKSKYRRAGTIRKEARADTIMVV